jgi:hypothetical protein
MDFFRRVFRFIYKSIADQWLRLGDMSIYFNWSAIAVDFMEIIDIEKIEFMAKDALWNK